MHPTTAPTPIQIPAFSVAGISVRTRNSEEMNPAVARLGGLWNRFFSQSWERKLPSRGDDGRIFGVYSGYESDEHGAFDVTAGVAVPAAAGAPEAPGGDVQAVDIVPGPYLVFTGQGSMPRMVIDTWGAVWRYFADHPEVQRRFDTDFEAYEGPERVAIHIGVAQ